VVVRFDHRMSAIAAFHIPHSATVIPADVRPSLLLSDEALAQELLRMTDSCTEELFAPRDGDAVAVRFPVSRLVVDPERYLDDAEEAMSSRGMGVIYTRTSDGAVLRAVPTPSERTDLITRHYLPHQAAMADAVGSALARHGRCLVVDCHSFPSRPLPCDLDQAPDRPEVCLGTDRVHTPVWLVDLAEHLFSAAGFDVAIDRPFSGAFVPARHQGRHHAVSAIMIELNRRLYMNEVSGARLPAFATVARTVQEILQKLVREFRSSDPF